VIVIGILLASLDFFFAVEQDSRLREAQEALELRFETRFARFLYGGREKDGENWLTHAECEPEFV